MTFETFDQSDEETWPDQQKDNDKDKYKDNDNDNDNDNNKYIWGTPSKSALAPERLVTFETLITFLTIENLISWQSLLPDN